MIEPAGRLEACDSQPGALTQLGDARDHFGIVAVYTSHDAKGELSSPTSGQVGQTLYIHGGQVDNLFCRKEEDTLRRWCTHARSLGVPVGCAGHTPEAHRVISAINAGYRSQLREEF